MADYTNPFTRNQNILDANREFLYKIANTERNICGIAKDYAEGLPSKERNMQKGLSFVNDAASITVGKSVDMLRNSMANSLNTDNIDPQEVLKDVNSTLEKYSIHKVNGPPAQMQSQLFHIMHRTNCPQEVKDACKQGIQAAKIRSLSVNRGIRKARSVKIARRKANEKLRRTEFGKGYNYVIKVVDRARQTIRTGLKGAMAAQKAALFVHLKAEALKARLAANALKKDPGIKWAQNTQKRIQKKQTKRKQKQRKRNLRRDRFKRFRRWSKDPIGLKRLGNRAANRILKTRVGHAVSLPVRALNALKSVVANTIATFAAIISQLITFFLIIGTIIIIIIILLNAVISFFSSIFGVFDVTGVNQNLQDEIFTTIQECYTEQVNSINDCYDNYDRVTINNVERRTEEVYKDLDIEETTNVAEIISMANIYFDFELEENKEDVLQYVKDLYAASNQVDIDVSSRVVDTGEVDENGKAITETRYDADITVTTYYFNDIFSVDVTASGGGGVWTGDMSGLPAWITPEAMQAVLEVQEQKDIPAAAILGQMIQESRGSYPGGCSGLCYNNKNCLGITKHKCQIKGTSSQNWDTTEYYGGNKVHVNRGFQVYKSLGDCIRCYGSTDIVSGRQSTLNKCTKDSKHGHYSTSSYVTAVWNSGYATSSTYVENVMSVVRAYNLERFNYMSPTSATALTGVEALISCGDYYCSALEKAVERGEKWVYSNRNKYVKQTGTFDAMLKGNVRGGNCATIANWAFREMGIIKKSQKFYGDGNGNIKNYNSGTSVKYALDQACYVIKGNKKKFSTLVSEGKIQPGDVIMGVGHTFIYRGDGVCFASGHDSYWHTDRSVKTEDPQKAVFEKWKRKYKGTFNGSFKVHYILRIRENYIPKYYRNANGVIVKNK